MYGGGRMAGGRQFCVNGESLILALNGESQSLALNE